MQKDVRKIYKNILINSLSNVDNWWYETVTSESLTDSEDYHYFSYNGDNIKISISRGINIVSIETKMKNGNIKYISFLSCFNFWFEPKLGKLFRIMKKHVKNNIKNKELNELIDSLPNNREFKVNKIINNIKNGK